jgi:RNase P/RNase MRP subunit POP5
MFTNSRKRLQTSLVSTVCLAFLIIAFLTPRAVAQGSSEEADDEYAAAQEIKSDEKMFTTETGDEYNAAQEMRSDEDMVTADTDDEHTAAQEIKSDENMAAVETEWLHVTGEVVAINLGSNLLTVNDERSSKPVIIKVDKSTTLATALSLSDINPGDTITVDYHLSGNIKKAENIILEERGSKEEKLPTLEKVLSD